MKVFLLVLIQAVAGFLIFIGLNYLATYILTREEVIEDPNKTVENKIIDGWIETNNFYNKKFTTYDMFSANYKKLPPSMNRKGGAQFSYTTWVKFNNLSAENVANKVLFMRGDATKYPYEVKVGTKATSAMDHVVKCPIVKFGDGPDKLIVEFNTTTDINARAEVSRVPSADETVRHNVFSLMPGKWTLLTFVFEDSKRYDEPEDGVVFTFYVNDVLYHTQRYAGALRTNVGDVHILPGGKIVDGFMSDLTYYNYAMTVTDITRVFNKGFTNKRFNDMQKDAEFNQPLYMSQYNKLEINNM